ncbi:MAG: SagB/ThcOx family dehydrogenase [Bacteroidales bacterium]|nr:SagB/ThcOx family dehydrogenase [Bacteroidales bacterium]MDZ4203440.1 SagB/ThcOx family dehydrogenase [Bacteroidales bacterium]
MKKLSIVMITFVCTLQMMAQESIIRLPEPQKTGGMPLMEALNTRHSERAFSPEELDLQTLSNLLWAGFGYNRHEAKKRTAPTSRNFQEIEIYLSMPSGLFRYNAWDNTLERIHDRDIRAITGKQEFVATAPINLIYVADQRKVPNPESEYQQRASYANTGFIAQNVYLYCASSGLVAVIRALFDETELSNAMGLDGSMKIILCHSVGYPKK